MKTKFNCFKKRIISAVMALVMLLGCCGYLFVQSDTAKAAMSSPMEINKDGDIVWGTISHANPDSGKRFHTVGWNFTIIRDGKTYKTEKVMLSDKSKIKTTGSADSSRMSYVLYGIKDDYIDDHDYQLVANAIIEFRDYSNGGTLIGTATTKTQADSLATKCGMSHGPYFNDGYFNQKVKWSGVSLKGKCDDGLTNPKIDGSRCGSKQSNYVATWVEKGDSPKVTVDAKKDANGNKGYAFVAGSNSSMRVTSSQGGDGNANAVNKNTTINMTSDALKVNVRFHVNGEFIGSQTFVYDEGDQFGTEKGLNFFDDYPDITKWYTNKDGESGTYFKVNQDVNNTVMMKLFNLNGKWQVADAKNGNKHTVDLYAESTPPPTDDAHYNIIYNGNGATSGTMDAQTAPKNISTMLSDIKYKKTGYHTSKTNTWKSKNKGVYYNNCQTVSYNTIDMDDDTKTKVTLYAQWKPNKCTIQYNGNGATSGTVGDQTITYDKWTQSISSNSYKKNGKNPDANWNTKPDGSGTSIKAGTKIDASVYKKLFGSASADGKTITLYAQWSGKDTVEEEDPDVKPVGQLSLTYKSGSDFGGESDGPFGYDINGNVTIKDCTFGEKYDTDTPKVYKYETGIDDVYEEQDYLIRAGSTIYEKYNKYFRFMGWSVDTNAIWSKSQSVIDYPNGVKSGKDLAYLYYGYKHPAKSNPAWNSSELASPVPKPLAALNPVDTASRASQILESKNAWIEYEKVLNREITTQTQKRDEEKAKMNQLKEQIIEVQNQIDSVRYPSSPSVAYPSPLPDKPTKAEQAAYDSAMASYNSAWDNYYSEVSYANRKKQQLQDELEELKKRYNMHKELYEKAQAKLNAAISDLNAFNADLTKTNNDPNGTYLYAVWDQFPEFINMDEIGINEDKIDQVTDEWLLSHVTVIDREDGRLTNGTDVVVENFNKSELKKLQHTGAVSVTFRATDSAGNVTRYTVNIWVTDSDPLEPDDLVGKLYYETGYSRGIRRESFEIGDPTSPNYYGKGYSGTTTRDDGTLVPIYLYVGGLHPESKWYTDPALKKEVYEGFANEENNTPEADDQQGLLFIKAAAFYRNPIGNIGSVEYSKKYLYAEKSKDENFIINYMLDQDTVYRTFSAKKKDTYPVPNDPTENGKVFIHWIDAEGNTYIKGQNFPATVDGSKTYYATFSTESVPATSMTLEAASDKMSVGSMQALKVTFTPDNATNRSLVWSSSNPSVLKVNSIGHVTALKAGEADISAQIADGSLPPASVHITVTEVTDIKVKADTSFVNDDGSTKKIEVSTPDGDIINADCSYTSSNSSVVTVNSLGVMDIVGNGTAYITVSHRRSGASTIIPVMAAEVRDYQGVYDKHAHTISIDCPGAEIMYSEEPLGIDADGWSNTCPTYTDAGIYTVYYKISFSSCTPIEGSAQVTIEKAERSLSLSTSEDTLVFPEEKTYTFESEEQDDTQISLTTENNDGCLAATRDGNKITVTSGIKEGDVDLNISIPETKNYKLTTKTIKIHVKNGTMAVDVAVPEGGVYDGENHTILVTPNVGFEDAVVTYASSEDGEYSAIPPECIDAGTHVVYYKVELPGYKTINGSAKVVIDKAPGELAFNKSEITLTPDTFCLLSVKTNLSEGAVTVADGNLNKMVTVEEQNQTVTVEEVKDEETGEVLIPASSTKLFAGYKISSGDVKKGTTYIKFKSAASKNYEEAECIVPIYVGEACGIYDEDGNLVIPWDELTGTLGANIQKDYTEETYKTDEASLYNAVKSFLSGESILSADFTVSNVKLTKIVVPPTRSKIGSYAFAGLDTITDIKFLNGITEIRKDAFSGCTNLKHVTLPDSFTNGADNLFAGVDVLCYDGAASGSPWGAAKLHDYADGSDTCSYCGTKNVVDEASLLSASNVAAFMNYKTTPKTFSIPLTMKLYSVIFG